MLSMRLWRKLAEAAIDDPIARRLSQRGSRHQAPNLARRPPRPLILAAVIACIAALFHSPGLLSLVLILPMLMITLMVASPVLLPLYAWLAGLQLTAEVISGITREKHQHTYELLCAAPRGPLSASWAVAAGILHSFDWYLPLRWGTRFCLLAGLGLLGGLGILALLLAVFGGQAMGMEQARLFLLIGMLLALYWLNLTQTLTLSLAAGVLASSFDLARHDALVVGIFLYVMLSLLPAVAGLVALAGLGEVAGFVVVVGVRELGVLVVWRGLGRIAG